MGWPRRRTARNAVPGAWGRGAGLPRRRSGPRILGASLNASQFLGLRESGGHHILVLAERIVHHGNGGNRSRRERQRLLVEAPETRFVYAARAAARRGVAQVQEKAAVLHTRLRVYMEERKEREQRIVREFPAGENLRILGPELRHQLAGSFVHVGFAVVDPAAK